MSGEYSETETGNTEVIVSFGGMASGMGTLGAPFEFVRSLKSMKPNSDRYFYVDHEQCHYHNGITGIADSIPNITKHLRKIISKYSKVTFIGCSAGGYAAILFGSILKVHKVIAFVPQTILEKKSPWRDSKKFINCTTDYVLFADKLGQNLHVPEHCNRLSHFSNVTVKMKRGLNMRQIRDDGTLKKLLDR